MEQYAQTHTSLNTFPLSPCLFVKLHTLPKSCSGLFWKLFIKESCSLPVTKASGDPDRLCPVKRNTKVARVCDWGT